MVNIKCEMKDDWSEKREITILFLVQALPWLRGKYDDSPTLALVGREEQKTTSKPY